MLTWLGSAMRAVTHVHTKYSWDGILAPDELVEALVNDDIELAVISDHDSFDGSLECREIVRRRDLDLQIPVAAEIRTDRGDVIVIFDDEGDSLPAIDDLKSWELLPSLVADRHGLVWLPHPYQSHEYIEELAAASHVIEVFNARCSDEQNRQAALLCERHGRVPGYGADVHRRSEVGGCVVDYAAAGSPTMMLRRTPTPINTVRTRKSEIMRAELTHGIKQRRPALATYMALRWMQHRRRERRFPKT